MWRGVAAGAAGAVEQPLVGMLRRRFGKLQIDGGLVRRFLPSAPRRYGQKAGLAETAGAASAVGGVSSDR